MKVLVTGGTGFLGGHLARRLLRQGAEVRVLGRNPVACAELARLGAEVVQADLRDENAVREACRGMEVVCHAGAMSEAWGRKRDFFEVNVGGTRHVIKGCREFGVRRFVYVSSSSVTFDGRSHRCISEATPFPKRFASVYSESKKVCEDVTREAAGYDLETVIVRPKALFGPGDPSLLPRIVRAARAGRLVQIGAGRNEIDLTYIDNAVDALVLALEHRNAANRTFLITGDETVRLWPFLRDILQRLGLPHELRRVPFRAVYALACLQEARATLSGREPVLTRFGVSLLARTQVCDISLARRELGYQPKINVAEGVQRTLAALADSR